MELTTMFTRVKRLTGASTYSQDNFLEDLNDVKNIFWSKYVSVLDDDRHYQEWTTASVLNQSEYTLKNVERTSEGTKAIKSVAINYDGETYKETGLLKYITAEKVNKDTLPNEWNYYIENQPQSKPIYFIADNSFFIAPAPRVTEYGDNKIKLTGIRNIIDYTINTTELEMVIPIDFHNILMLGVIPYALMTKRVDNNEVIKAQNDYKTAELDALLNLSTRKEGPITMDYPEEESIYK